MKEFSIDQKINIKALYQKHRITATFYEDLKRAGIFEVLNRLAMMLGYRHHELWSNKSFRNQRLAERKAIDEFMDKEFS